MMTKNQEIAQLREELRALQDRYTELLGAALVWAQEYREHASSGKFREAEDRLLAIVRAP